MLPCFIYITKVVVVYVKRNLRRKGSNELLLLGERYEWLSNLSLSTNPPSQMPKSNTLSPHTFPVSSYPLHNIGYEYFQYRISIHMLTLTLTLPFTHRTIYPITIHIGYEHFQYRISIHLFTSHVRWVQRLWYGISR